ncbi:hypothetical protein [Xanthomonas oryzae]|uniref:hypothetical protein n=1 Tax=Xanthomonas oryzae TaxID=347 RepID=UPI000DDE6A48|nr:hypothetical protein [Xanthomonas oryzae]RBE99505.1 hypothetical protein BRM91_03235 [Xanthomonas oryzae pv. oryzae]
MSLLHPVARFIGAALLALAAPMVCAQTRDGSLYDALADLSESAQVSSGAQRAEAVVSLYERMVGTADPCAAAKLPFDEDDLFRATVLAEGYSFDPRYVHKLGCLYARLQRQGRVTRWHIISYADALASISRFDAANRILAALPTRPLAPLPTLAFERPLGSSRRVIDIVSPTHAVVRVFALHDDRLAILAVVHPDCHFSANGLNAIVSSEDDRWLRERLVLLVAPGARPPIDGIAQWNRRQPMLPMHLMYQRSDWAFLHSTGTPTFYLVRGSTILETFAGWPNSDGLARMKAALQRESAAEHGSRQRR